jgi:peptidoglycan/LPS O-acetylase OafA/YrhL
MESVLTTQPGRPHRVVGLDSLRFLAAFVVMLYHLELLGVHYGGFDKHGLLKGFLAIYNQLFNGPAAVIVFFLISGFCIHFPFRRDKPMAVASFYSRRFLRILGPAIVFLVVLRLVIHNTSSLRATIFWSLLCEMTYYLLYPALLYLRRRSNWALLIAGASLAAAGCIVVQRGQLDYGMHAYAALGISTWVVGLPCWLLGCLLAETYGGFKLPSRSRIVTVRTGIFLLTIFLGILRFHIHSPLTSDCVLLDLFAFPAYYWLGMEIAYFSAHRPSRLLEWAGAWSYSLYIVHPLVIPLLALWGLAGFTGRNATHFLVFPLILLLSYLFHLAVERPSHKLAVWTSRRFAPRPFAPTTAGMLPSLPLVDPAALTGPTEQAG